MDERADQSNGADSNGEKSWDTTCLNRFCAMCVWKEKASQAKCLSRSLFRVGFWICIMSDSTALYLESSERVKYQCNLLNKYFCDSNMFQGRESDTKATTFGMIQMQCNPLEGFCQSVLRWMATLQQPYGIMGKRSRAYFHGTCLPELWKLDAILAVLR